MKMINKKAGLAITALSLLPVSGLAVPISNGIYELHNHPDGGMAPPLYGLRLDELFNITSGNDVWTFDFDAVGSNMKMLVNGSTINIYGTTVGGRDTGAGYAPGSTAIFDINFTYQFFDVTRPGVVPLVGDAPSLTKVEDLIVPNTPGGMNPPDAGLQGTGTITVLAGFGAGSVFQLRDNGMDHTYSFQLGDEANDVGHRGFPGISGWGWVDHRLVGTQDWNHGAASDWLFTAVPEPSTVISGSVLGLLAAGGAFRRFRKQA
ncbi:MAG: hypothetical protein SFY81_10225 [Verrucomicrobiota bacterium]|nr:hypothetical protein [Verrucomicrobiota bacterium]